MKVYKKRMISFLFTVILMGSHVAMVNADEPQPCSTNILYLTTSLSVSGSCLEGMVGGTFTGSGLHAIYYSEFQYLSSYGEYTTIGDIRAFRSYKSGITDAFNTYYCNPIPGVKYRFHTNMKVYDSDDNIKDSDVINSNTLVW